MKAKLLFLSAAIVMLTACQSPTDDKAEDTSAKKDEKTEETTQENTSKENETKKIMQKKIQVIKQIRYKKTLLKVKWRQNTTQMSLMVLK